MEEEKSTGCCHNKRRQRRFGTTCPFIRIRNSYFRFRVKDKRKFGKTPFNKNKQHIFKAVMVPRRSGIRGRYIIFNINSMSIGSLVVFTDHIVQIRLVSSAVFASTEWHAKHKMDVGFQARRLRLTLCPC